jgi:hypothetical protein
VGERRSLAPTRPAVFESSWPAERQPRQVRSDHGAIEELVDLGDRELYGHGKGRHRLGEAVCERRSVWFGMPIAVEAI